MEGRKGERERGKRGRGRRDIRRVHNPNHPQLTMHNLRTVKPNRLRIVDRHHKFCSIFSRVWDYEAGIETIW
jgi:hypothetical protein